MKKVLITGASRGIGKAAAGKFAAEGYEVVAPSSKELDLKNSRSIEGFIRKNKGVYFSSMINNAGINDLNRLQDITDDEIERTLNINLVAPLKLIRAFVPAMIKEKFGRIVNIGSIWAAVSKPGRLAYSASKNGLHGVTNTAALELGAYNILVNTLCPGFTNTELTKKNIPEKERAVICAEIPLGRMAEPEEIAAVIFFLGSEQNTYITGQKILADGGFTAR